MGCPARRSNSATSAQSYLENSTTCNKVNAKDFFKKSKALIDLSQLPKITIKKGDPYPSWVDLLAATGVVDSKSAARRIVKEGGGYLNNKKVESEDFTPSKNDLLHGKYLLLRKGKRDLAAVEVIS